MELEPRLELERVLVDEKLKTVVAGEKREHTKTRYAIALSALPTWGPIVASGAGAFLGYLGLHGGFWPW
jgi:hypothetical protein